MCDTQRVLDALVVGAAIGRGEPVHSISSADENQDEPSLVSQVYALGGHGSFTSLWRTSRAS
jgi:hypothetical protein